MASPTQLEGADIFDTNVRIKAPDDRDPTDVETLVRREVDQAIQWHEQNIEPHQAKATDYYKARPFGDEREGRSQVVSQDVREAVHSILPTLMRVFFGSERTVEFKPKHEEDAPEAKQQTEYVNYIFTEDNPGFLEAYSAFKDALIRKLGVLKFWWEKKVEVTGHEYSGLTADELAYLTAPQDVTATRIEEHAEEGQPPTYSATILRKQDHGRARVAAVPPEEFVWNASARSLDDARMVAHVRELRMDELVAMGVDEDVAERHAGRSVSIGSDTQLRAARRPDDNVAPFNEDQPNETRPVRFADVWMRIDEDNDGVAELRHIWLVGEPGEIVLDEIADTQPFALFGPDPEPHAFIGDSIADALMQLQRIKSAIQRGMLDSLAAHINPAQEAVESEVNMADLLNDEVGRIIRTKKPGMIREIGTTFVGGDALPVLGYLDDQKDRVTGISQAAAGLDADALQSSTQMAVAATVKAAQARVELIARIFAETGMKHLFKGLLKLVTEHQDAPRVIRLSNEFVRIDPRSWDADKDLRVNVALGTGLVEEKMRILEQIIAKQEMLLQAGAPLVGLSEYRATLARYLELAGFRNPDEFFKPFGPKQEAAMQQAQAQQPKQPSDNEVLFNIEMAKVQEKRWEKLMDLLTESAKLELERAKAAGDQIVNEAKVGLDINSRAVELAHERAQMLLEHDTAWVDHVYKMSKTALGGGENDGSGS